MPEYYKVESLQKRIRILLILFIVGLVLSGLTAFPIKTQLGIAHTIIQKYQWHNVLTTWLERVYVGMREIDTHYPFVAYGTDWLGFAHLVIAIAFIGPLRDPVRNIWVVQFGIIACISVFPFSLVAGEVRDIPFFWRIIDCSFGVFGGLLLWRCESLIKRLTVNVSYKL